MSTISLKKHDDGSITLIIPGPGDAEYNAKLDKIREWYATYGFVTVADLHILADEPYAFEESLVGWENLDNMSCTVSAYHFEIYFPAPKNIEVRSASTENTEPEKPPVPSNNKSVGYRAGQAVGAAFTVCLAACLIGIMLSLTIKFLLWIF